MKIYDTENERIVKEQVADTTGSGHGALAGFLSGLKVGVPICGGVGAETREILPQAGSPAASPAERKVRSRSSSPAG